jgi:hypothetical protein
MAPTSNAAKVANTGNSASNTAFNRDFIIELISTHYSIVMLFCSYNDNRKKQLLAD